MTARYELTAAEWDLLQPLLPTDPPRGGRWQDHRTVISGILFRERTGIPWRDPPPPFRYRKTAYQRKTRPAPARPSRRIARRARLGTHPRASRGRRRCPA